ncbi:hypothetical protein ISS30_08655 [bacterium]|nr:hypothetical protein [FCB group bacterium]MBL7191753.1 hypothetical protein [bacterium]
MEAKEIQSLIENPTYTKVMVIQRLINYKLKDPLYINLEIYPDGIIAEHTDTESWAEAETEYEAIDGLRIEIEDLYEHLKNTPDEQLGRNPLSWKRLLNSCVEEY